jgi:hypothetical protein
VETAARYNGFAAWYDEHLAEFTLAAGDVIDRLLGLTLGHFSGRFWTLG